MGRRLAGLALTGLLFGAVLATIDASGAGAFQGDPTTASCSANATAFVPAAATIGGLLNGLAATIIGILNSVLNAGANAVGPEGPVTNALHVVLPSFGTGPLAGLFHPVATPVVVPATIYTAPRCDTDRVDCQAADVCGITSTVRFSSNTNSFVGGEVRLYGLVERGDELLWEEVGGLGSRVYCEGVNPKLNPAAVGSCTVTAHNVPAVNNRGEQYLGYRDSCWWQTPNVPVSSDATIGCTITTFLDFPHD